MDLISEPLGISEKFELCMKGKSLRIILTIYYKIEKLTVVALQTKYKLCRRIAAKMRGKVIQQKRPSLTCAGVYDYHMNISQNGI